ncbi:Neuropeptide FF receptor 2 [Trichoplax sp. H2]|uniref:G-protein coupled receptors family 1 profile domain-containing protein n=1 Tax=Trichoplax adhaerens TaxID=10228 RepID=B3SD82_TRIAD|nr:hypothetical protein TRIADDRAFT_62239 [Trichoplax adhaerens]EDV19335.1 hypothetical protein TRIADDRAFT_62239 [Trichoplax adhaerens]RDD38738.1 Neuropeptide FF receptor 2 [Trichoplax sp. H2]|eukprot:XP_002118186.1 hypothetical protein TRIADDRAFT_62239 [Trichoplax adhaerens]
MINSKITVFDIGIFYAEANTTMIVGLLAMVLNLIVGVAFIKGKRLNTPASLFLANLTVTDLVCALSLILDSITNYILLKMPMNTQYVDSLCKFSNFLCGLSYITLSASLSGLSTERYNVIVRTKSKGFQIRTAKIMVGLIWIYGAVVATPLVFVFGINVIIEDKVTNYSRCVLLPENSTFNTIYYSAGFIGLFLLPFMSMLYAYYKIAMRIYSNKRPGESAIRVMTTREKSKRRQIIILFFMSMAFMLSSLPYFVLLLIVPIYSLDGINIYHESRIFWIMYVTAKLLYTCSCLYDPILYNFIRLNFRKSFKDTFNPCSPKPKAQIHPTGSSKVGTTEIVGFK